MLQNILTVSESGIGTRSSPRLKTQPPCPLCWHPQSNCGEIYRPCRIKTTRLNQVREQKLNGILVQDKGSALLEENHVHHNQIGILIGYLHFLLSEYGQGWGFTERSGVRM